MKKFILAFTAILSIGLGAAFANYTMTQGAGTTFGSVVVGGFHYVQMFVCDLTTPAQCQSVSAAGAAKVDGSAVTQPVSNAGTFAAQLTGATNNINNIAGTVSLPTGASTSANQTSQITQETATAAALGTTTDAVGATPSTGSAATLVSLAKAINNNVSSAIPAGTNIIGKVGIDQTTPGTTNLVALAANQSMNEAQINGVTPLMGNGVTGTGSQRVTVASDNTPFPIKIDQTTPGTTNNVAVSYGSVAAVADPCQTATKVYTPINVVTATNTIITGVSAKKKYVCGIFLYPAGTQNVAIFQATTATACATALVAVIGGTTTATGVIMTAQAGFVLGNGASAVAATTVNQTDLCVVTSAAVQLSGVVVTVDQ
jgi:hypothetical protein